MIKKRRNSAEALSQSDGWHSNSCNWGCQIEYEWNERAHNTSKRLMFWSDDGIAPVRKFKLKSLKHSMSSIKTFLLTNKSTMEGRQSSDGIVPLMELDDKYLK